MFKAKFIQVPGLLIASLAPASLAHGALIIHSATIDSVFAFTASGGPDSFVGFGTNNSPILLPEFDPSLGTLTDVQLFYTIQVVTSTQVLNFTQFLQPPFATPVPDPVQVVPAASTVVAFNVSGFPVVTTSVPTLSGSEVVPYGVPSPITSLAVTNGSTRPDFLLSSFKGSGFVPLNISTQNFLTLNAFPLLAGPTVGTVLVEPTQVTITGNIQAFYTYTPLTATLAPEPPYGAFFGLVFACAFLSRKRNLGYKSLTLTSRAE